MYCTSFSVVRAAASGTARIELAVRRDGYDHVSAAAAE